jgi:hypothetical protein
LGTVRPVAQLDFDNAQTGPGIQDGPLTASAALLQEISFSPAPSLLGQRPASSAPARRKKALPPDFTPRRSNRLRLKDDGKHVGPVVRAQTVLIKRLGLTRGEETVTKEKFDEYLELFKRPLAPQHIRAVAALFDPDGADFDELAQEGFAAFSLPLEVEPSGA